MASLGDIGDTRTIPTLVGRGCPARPSGRRIADHPHARGERRGESQIMRERFGPSPRSWGEESNFKILREKAQEISESIVPKRLLMMDSIVKDR